MMTKYNSMNNNKIISITSNNAQPLTFTVPSAVRQPFRHIRVFKQCCKNAFTQNYTSINIFIIWKNTVSMFTKNEFHLS